jgi:hypothetical protein
VSDAEATEAAAVAEALRMSRDAYDDTDANLDAALLASMGIDATTAVGSARRPATGTGSSGGSGVANSSGAPAAAGGAQAGAGGAAAAPTLEADLLRQVMANSEAEATQAALLEQLRHQHEQEQIAAALAASRGTGGQLALGGLAVGQAGPVSSGGAAQGTGSAVDDDAELQRALAMSLQGAGATGHGSAAGGATATGFSDPNLLYEMALGLTEEQQLAMLLTGQVPAHMGGTGAADAPAAPRAAASAPVAAVQQPSLAAPATSAPSQPQGGHRAGEPMQLDDDDDAALLQAAIAASLQPHP